MTAMIRNGQLQYQPDDKMMQALVQFASNVGGSLAKAAGATALVGGAAAAVTGAGTAGTAVAGAGAVALVTTAAMEEDSAAPLIKHQSLGAVPEEGITLQVTDAGGQHDSRAPHPASNSLSRELATSAIAETAQSEQLDATYARYRELLPVMKNMGIELEGCEIGESTQHGCAVQNRPRGFDLPSLPPRR